MPDTQEMLIKHRLSRTDSGKGWWKGESLTSEIFKYGFWNFEEIIQGGQGQVKLVIKHSLNTVWIASFLAVGFGYFQELSIISEHHEFKPFWTRLWINQRNEWLCSLINTAWPWEKPPCCTHWEVRASGQWRCGHMTGLLPFSCQIPAWHKSEPDVGVPTSSLQHFLETWII